MEVLEAGLLTTVQDADGRIGWRRFGVPVSGAIDAFSARLANRLVGNPDHAALLEATVVGPIVRFERATLLAIAGADLGAQLDGRAPPLAAAVGTRPGAVLSWAERRSGSRAYLAVAGGLAVEPILGSRATDLRGGFGGLEGRALRTGDRLEVAATAAGAPHRLRSALAVPTGPVRLLPGPHADRFAGDVLERLCDHEWSVSAEADRAGVRLDGPAIQHAASAEVPSVALPLGAVQVPPDGRPIVMLADRPVTGGYAVAACVIRADIGRVAQLLPGDRLRFALTTTQVALAALRDQERVLDELEPIAPDEVGADAAWAGAHE